MTLAHARRILNAARDGKWFSDAHITAALRVTGDLDWWKP